MSSDLDGLGRRYVRYVGPERVRVRVVPPAQPRCWNCGSAPIVAVSFGYRSGSGTPHTPTNLCRHCAEALSVALGMAVADAKRAEREEAA